MKLLIGFYNRANKKAKNFIIKVLIKCGSKEPWNNTVRILKSVVDGIEIGYGTYGAFGNAFPRGTQIGNYCSISSGVKCFAENHPMDYVSMHPLFYESEFGGKVKDNRQKTRLEIGNGCWIGYNVIITSGCAKIGNGAVIGAGAVVTKDIPRYAIVAGVPAKIIGYRFNEKQIELIEKSEWWKYDKDMLLSCAEYIDNVDLFCRKLAM